MGMMQWNNLEKKMPYQPTTLEFYQSVVKLVGIAEALCGVSVPLPSQGKRRLTKQPRRSKEKKKMPRLAAEDAFGGFLSHGGPQKTIHFFSMLDEINHPAIKGYHFRSSPFELESAWVFWFCCPVPMAPHVPSHVTSCLP